MGTAVYSKVKGRTELYLLFSCTVALCVGEAQRVTKMTLEVKNRAYFSRGTGSEVAHGNEKSSHVPSRAWSRVAAGTLIHTVQLYMRS